MTGANLLVFIIGAKWVRDLAIATDETTAARMAMLIGERTMDMNGRDDLLFCQ
jgi:hypothetical protein